MHAPTKQIIIFICDESNDGMHLDYIEFWITVTSWGHVRGYIGLIIGGPIALLK